MVRRMISAAALCALAATLFPISSYAHGGNPNMESAVRTISPHVPGFSVGVLNGDDRLVAVNKGSQTVVIYGYNKEPYVRLSPGGAVDVNVRSPAYYLNRDRFLGAKIPAIADEHAPPQWKPATRNGRYEFHDHRMHWMAKTDPPSVKDKSKRQKIFDWKVPLRVQGKDASIDGTLFWRGTGAGAPVGAFVALALIALLGGAIVVVVRRRRGTGPGGALAAGAGEAGTVDDQSGGREQKEAW